MKKFFVLVCCAIAFFAISNKTSIYNVIDFSEGETYVVLNEVPNAEDIIKVGSKQELKAYENKLKGVTYKTDGGLVKAYVILNKLSADIVKVNRADGFVEVLAYSKKLSEKKLVGGNSVNVQIVINENEVVVGVPLIFDCY